MFARRGHPLAVNRVVTNCAGRGIGIIRQCDLQGLVHILVAGSTGCGALRRQVPGMTFEASRDVPMPVMMAGGAVLLRMGAGETDQLLRRSSVAISADRRELVKRRSALRRMRVFMAIGAGGLFRPMWLAMATPAAWHQFGVIILKRVVHVKQLMAFLAGETVLATGIFQAGIVLQVTLTAINRCQRLRIVSVKFSGDLWKLAHDLGGARRPGETPGRQNHCQSAQEEAESR